MDPPYNVRRDRDASSSEFDVITLQDMRDMEYMSEDVMKLGEMATRFSLYLLPVWYKALVSQFMKKRTSIDSDDEESGSESEKKRLLRSSSCLIYRLQH